MSSQSAVAVAVTMVRLVSSAVSLAGRQGDVAIVAMETEYNANPSVAALGREETSTFAFFSCLLGVSFLGHSMTLKTPAYKILVVPVERKTLALADRGMVSGCQALLVSSPVTLLLPPR